MKFSGADVREAAMAICQETCAFMGEPPCWRLKHDDTGNPLPWPPPTCDEPGCMLLAHVALMAVERPEPFKFDVDAIREL